MAESPFFDRACEALERETSLSRLEARGTMRFALKAAGFDTRSVNRPQILATIFRCLPDELRRRGIGDPDKVCEQLVRLVAGDGPIGGAAPAAGSGGTARGR